MDAEARFRDLFEEAYPALQRYARHRGLGREDADDLVAAVLETVWRRLGDVPRDDPLPWCYAVAHNHLRNLRRADGRRQALIARLPIPKPVNPSDAADPMAAEALLSALDDLSDDDQELLRLVAWEGLDPSQAAVVLGCSAVAARTRLHRARRRLAARLATPPTRPNLQPLLNEGSA